ncbi:MAG: hypothetical protein GY701_21170, partial [Sulfitobacter sp.]|nr:hypothetical protein [Sulfitobacter sp.]
AAGATGPEEWVLVAARALAAEQLVLERPGEVNLLDYFTEDSPYLEETVRGVDRDYALNGWRLEGLLVQLRSVVVLAEFGDRVLLELELINGIHLVREADGAVRYESTDTDVTTVQITVTTGPPNRTRVHDRERVR